MLTEAYKSTPGISQSAIKAWMTCPEYYRRKYVVQDFDEDTKAMQFGSAVDLYVSDTKKFEETYVRGSRRSSKKVVPEGTETDTPEEGEEGQSPALNVVTLTPAVYDEAVATGKFVLAQPVFQELTKGLECQKVLSAEYQGLKIKGCLDYYGYSEDKSVIRIIDLKTCRDATWPIFGRSINQYGYLFQLAFYRILARLSTGDEKTPIQCYLAAVDGKTFRMYEINEDAFRPYTEYLIGIMADKPWERGAWEGPVNHICPLAFECPRALTKNVNSVSEEDLAAV